MRKAIREEVKYGSDWIKLLVTGAFMTAGDNPMAVHFTEEELGAAVEEARRLGKDVMAHAHSASGIKAALQCGVRSIEHATMIDADCIQLMKERNSNPADPRGECWIVPTLFIGDYYHQKEISGDLSAPGKLTSLRDETESVHITSLRNAVVAGVADRICLGSDYVGWPVALNYMEFECLVNKIGLSPFQALAAATINAARMLRLAHLIGSIEVGKVADLVAVEGNPLESVSVLRNVRQVIHNGQPISIRFANI
jgi:imidazolonepropionase-like amidohydrolase